jgi:hypothetical protein
VQSGKGLSTPTWAPKRQGPDSVREARLDAQEEMLLKRMFDDADMD